VDAKYTNSYILSELFAFCSKDYVKVKELKMWVHLRKSQNVIISVEVYLLSLCELLFLTIWAVHVRASD